MELIQSVAAMQAHADHQRGAGQRLVLVPTMGALHEGHMALIAEARERGTHVIVSIFVNPTQFVPGEDYERYPRTLQKDLQRLAGVDVVFAPTVEEMYPDGVERAYTTVRVGRLGEHLCGPHRPGHFEGVATVVTKLFDICKPHTAIFGLKDAQQLLIIRRLVRDLSFDIDVVGVATQREEDGLARSSRNRYLNAGERAQAVVLSRAVQAAQQRIQDGEQEVQAIVESMHRMLEKAPLAQVQYAEVVGVETLQPVTRLVPGQEVLAAVAVFFGATRLIDNAFATAPDTP